MALLVPRRFELKAYDKHLGMLGVLIGRNSDAHSASFTAEYNGVGTGTVTLPIGHKLIPALATPGARLHYRYVDHTDYPVLQLSGMIKADQAEVSLRTGTVTFTMVSDEVLLKNTLGWPVPTAGLSAQTSEYDTRTGPVDAICADLAVANLITRRALPCKIVPLFADGPTATIKARMHPLWDVIKPALETAHYGIRLWQWNPGDPEPFFLAGQLAGAVLLLEVYKSVDRPYVNWTPLLGITSGTAAFTAPTVTRVVVGGGGEGTARVFQGYVDDAREAEWGPLGVVERFVDARDTSDAGVLAQRASEELTEGAGTTTLDVSTVDGDPWVYGADQHYALGDRVRVTPVEGITRIEKVRAVTVSIDGEHGIRISPRIGDPSPVSDPTVAILRTQAKTRTRTTSLETRR